tara:strand:+ start:205 stop:573 length:369 start_codon:yes stop_codon:yes gene_type:complete
MLKRKRKIKELNKSLQGLGELESDIMDVVWKRECVCVRDVLDDISKNRNVAYTTIMTVMCRLAEKGVLTRCMEKDGAYSYMAVKDKAAYMAKAARLAVRRVISTYGDAAVKEFKQLAQAKRK